MKRYLAGRIGQAALVLWAAFTLSFLLLQVLPGDAILIKFQNPDMGLSPAQIADMRAAYGADVPLWGQYLHTLGSVLHGDLGFSMQAGVPVTALLAANLPATLQLAVLGFAVALLLALRPTVGYRRAGYAGAHFVAPRHRPAGTALPVVRPTGQDLRPPAAAQQRAAAA